MNNEEIVLFESSDGSLHTISLTPEQLAELGLQIQYTNPPPVILDAQINHENVINSTTEELVVNVNQVETTVNNANTTGCVESNNIIDESRNNIGKTNYVEESPLPITNISHLQNVVRLSDIPSRGQRGFQLITDHIAPDNWISKKSNILTTDGVRINKHPSNVAASSNDFVWKKNGFLPKKKAILAAVNKTPAPPPGHFTISHNEIIPSVIPDNNIIQKVPLILNNSNTYINQPLDVAGNQNQTVAQNLSTHEGVTNTTKPKNGTNCYSKQSIIDAKKKNISLKAPVVPFTLAPKPPRKILPQLDVSKNIRWTKGQPHQVVHILQNGDQYHSVEKLNSEQLRVVSDAISSVGPTPNNQNKVLYDPTSKTRVVYRVVYPEDLNLCNGKDAKAVKPGPANNKTTAPVIHYKNIILPKKGPKPKQALALASPSTQVVSVTRSGRRVRPPRHMAQDFEQDDADGSTLMEVAPGLPAIPDPPTNEVTVKKRIVCPACDKTYHSEKRIGKHLMTFPDHALTEKTEGILKKYKLENPPKEIQPNEKNQTNVQNEKPTPILALEVNQAKNIDSERDTMNSVHPIKHMKEDKSLFGSLTRIIEHTSEEYRASVFIRQLAALIVKLRKLMPCLLFRDVGSSPCLINEPVGKILDLTPGKYHLNMTALKCSGLGGENCTHATPPLPKENITTESNDSANTWITNKNVMTNENKEPVNDFIRSSSVSDWTSNTAKRKWIPIGSQSDTAEEPHVTDDSNWMPNKSTTMIDTTQSFSQRVESIKTWDSTMQKQCRVSQSTPRSPWDTRMTEQLPKIDLPQEILTQNLILNTSNQTIQIDDSTSFDCNDKIDDLHSNLVYGIKDQINLDSSIDLKNSLSCNSQSTGSSDGTEGPENFDFNDSRFDLQINSDKLNFSNSEYSQMKYGALPPFRKIEPAKSLQLPLDALGDISSDADKLHMSTDNILNNGNYPITSESLGLKIDNNHHIQTMDTSGNTHKVISINEVNEHCNSRSLLNDSELNLPISVSNTLSTNVSMLSVSESSLDGGRMNLSTSQSVLHLLDPLGTDCLSFTDAELRPTSQMSLDLQLDLFPFHHP